MKLFDERDRDDDRPALYAEPDFHHLSRSARQSVQRVRETLETWFSRYPSANQAKLRSDFRAKKNSSHQSAFFELFLHELLIRLGCQVEIHPKVEGSTGRPDFLVDSPTGSSFYLEAVLATNESAEGAAARARVNVVYDALYQLDSPNFFIGMDLRGAPKTPPPARKIRAFLSNRLNILDPDDIALPRWRYEYEGWRIVFYPIPKPPGLRGKPGIRPIRERTEIRSFDATAAIRGAIVSKAGGYGDLRLPYVIAVNVLEYGVDHDDALLALFGKEPFSGRSDPKLGVHEGAWFGVSGPRYTRVSAALLATLVLPEIFPKASIRLYHNPWAKRPYKAELTRLPQAVPLDDRMEWQDGKTLDMIFDLPPGWPER